jgi:uncharacterized membrane protein
VKTLIVNTGKDLAAYLLLSLATFLMLRMIVQYYPLNDHTAFLQFKQAYIDNKVWKTCFYIHVFTSLFVLMAGFTQFSSYVQKHNRNLHRILGRLYAYNIFFINFPAAMVMAIYANGELIGKTAFILLDSLWFYFTLKGVIAARQKNFEEHRQYMIRSYALTLSAISLRTWKAVLVATTSLDLHTIYIIDAWLGFVPNLLFAEWIIRRQRFSALALKGNIVNNQKEQYQPDKAKAYNEN